MANGRAAVGQTAIGLSAFGCKLESETHAISHTHVTNIDQNKEDASRAYEWKYE